MLKVLDLFSGIGGFSLGLERTGGFKTVAFCEIEPFCRAVLRKHWPDVPCFEDVRTLKGSDVGDIDVICGGYPCQPFSVAGKRLGAADDRHLWPEYFRLVQELRPTWIIGENVAGHINMGLDAVLSDLESAGYSARTFVIPAVAVDAKHRRDRLWIVGHAEKLQRDGGKHYAGSNSQSARKIPKFRNADSADAMAYTSPAISEWAGDSWSGRDGFANGGETLAYPSSCGCAGSREPIQRCSCAANGEGKTVDVESGCKRAIWSPEPNVGRVANGVPRRVDRLKALGNAVVPQIPEIIGRAILSADMARQTSRTEGHPGHDQRGAA